MYKDNYHNVNLNPSKSKGLNSNTKGVNDLGAVINLIEAEDRFLAGSREVAKNFNKKHYNLIRDIENLIEKNPSTFEVLNYFIKSNFEHRGNEYKEYLLTRDGLSLLVMGYTGTKALEWKIKYIDAFNELEKMMMQNQPLKVEGLKDQKLLEANCKISELENKIIISYEESNELRKLTSKRVLFLLKKCDVSKSKLYGSLWRDYREKFSVSSYHNTLKKDLDHAEKFIGKWELKEGN